MDHHRTNTILRLLTLAAAVSLILSACVTGAGETPLAPASGISVWLDQSPDGWTLPLKPFTLKAHASASAGSGITSISFLVSDGGSPVDIGSVTTDPSQPLVYAELVWNPAASGVYLIQAQAMSATGSQVSQTAKICVLAGSDVPSAFGSPCGRAFIPSDTPLPQQGPPVPPTWTPTPTETPRPVFDFTVLANCRLGPNALYASVGYGQAGDRAQIEGISDPAGWYYVLLADGLTRCFVAGTTGTVSGPVDGLSVIPAPPLPVAPAAPVLNVSNQICDSKQYVVRLSWKDVNGETGYRVYRDGALISTLGPDITSYEDASPDYKPHEYFVEAFNSAGAVASAKTKSSGCTY